jgi:oligopeptide transport system ATP-binding protein
VSTPLLEVRDLRVEFTLRRALYERARVTALDSVSLSLSSGETLGVVGESGAGKSTLARAILRLVPATSGAIVCCGRDWLALRGEALRRARRDVQIVFQDPLGSLDPRMTIGEILAEPLRTYLPAEGRAARQARIARMLATVGLAASMSGRYPREFSGGECQRVGIARAMLAEPKILICDEATSSLDVSIRGQIVNLLKDLQRECGTAILFVSHDLGVVRHLCHRVLVMQSGRVVEEAPAASLFAAARHPYTRALLAAIPMIPAIANPRT